MLCTECGHESEDVNEFVISASNCVCLPCAEQLTAEAEGLSVIESEEQVPDVSDEEGVEMTVSETQPEEEEEPEGSAVQ